MGRLEIIDHTLGDDRPNAFDGLQLLYGGGGQRVHALEVAGEQPRRRLADETDAQGEHHPFEGHLARTVDGVDDVAGRPLAASVAVDVLHLYAVEVGHVVDESAAIVLADGFGTERVDVHGLSRDEMLYAPLDLWGAPSVVGTIPGGRGCALAVGTVVAHQTGAALRAVGDELYGLGDDGALVEIDAHNLGNDFAAFLHIDEVADVQVEGTDEVFVVERGASDGGAGQLHGLHVGHGVTAPVRPT